MLLRVTPGAMLAFYRDTFASQAAKDQPIYDMQELFGRQAAASSSPNH
jgi:hypothetical protein